MKLFLSRVAVVTAGLGMALSPIASSAATRASDNPNVYQMASSAPGIGRSAEGEELVAPGILVAVLAGAAIIGGIVIIDGDDDNQSPGAN